MASSQIYSAEIGERSAATPGDIDSATAMPDVSSVNFLAFPCEGVIDAAGGGTESVSEAEYGSNKPGATTPRSTSFLNRTGAASFGTSDNQRIAHMEVDTVTMTARFVEFGTSTVFDGSGDPQQPEAVMLGSVMGYDKPGITSITANGAGANFGEVPVDDLTGIEAENDL